MINKIGNRYGLGELFQLGIFLIRTKLIHHKARIIRFPFTIRGKRYMDLGLQLTTGVGCRFEAFETGEETKDSKKILLGNHVQINDYVHLSAIESIIIGNDVLIASHVYISDNSHGSYQGDDDDTSPELAPIKRPYRISPIRIGDRVWIGEGVIILPGVTIGEGSIIGAHAVVSHDIPPYTIAAGTPAKPIKQWDSNKQHWIKPTNHE